jgi:hypothetical protein
MRESRRSPEKAEKAQKDLRRMHGPREFQAVKFDFARVCEESEGAVFFFEMPFRGAWCSTTQGAA